MKYNNMENIMRLVEIAYKRASKRGGWWYFHYYAGNKFLGCIYDGDSIFYYIHDF